MNNLDYQKVTTLREVFCKTCANIIRPNDVYICLSDNELIIKAEIQHKELTNCLNPALLIHYGTALLSNELYNELINSREYIN